jgi:hypothetical protein
MTHAQLPVNDRRDTVLLAQYGSRWRWWPNPPSRQSGSQRWIVPAVDGWHWADSPEDARSQQAADASASQGNRPQDARNAYPAPIGAGSAR